MASDKRCLYEILGLNRDCAPEEIRSAYRKLALQRHPDKLVKTGIREEEATAAFQELVNAYEVLSDPRERAWYDSHRSQILFSDPKSKSKSSSSFSSVPDLFSFFSNSVFSGFGDTKKGFYKVYGDVFGKIYAQELLFAKKLGLGFESVKVAPLMGNLDSPYAQVSAFYSYWLGFVTIMDFCWVDEYEVMSGSTRKLRRLMEDENKKLRKKAKREYVDTVRGLAEFVKKRDKRVIDMQMKKNLEQEKRRDEEKARKKELERAKLEKLRMYQEPDWATIDEEIENELEEEEADNNNNKKNNELYCVVCSKKFKSDKQWKNHEQSKKHLQKVAELRSTFDTEKDEEEEEEILAGDSVESQMDELEEKFEESINIMEEDSEIKISSSHVEGTKVSNDINGDRVSESFGSEEEMGVPSAMLSRHKTKRNAASKRQAKLLSSRSSYDNVDDYEEINLMEYNNRRTTRRNRAAKREAVKISSGESLKVEAVEEVIKESNGEAVRAEAVEEVTKESNREALQAEVVEVAEDVISNSNSEGQGLEDSQPDSPHLQDSSPHMSEESVPNFKRNPLLGKNQKVVNWQSDKKDIGKRDTDTNTRNTSKGKKQKRASKATVLSCVSCGENFDSRNKLHKHLGDTGHATLKSRC